MSHSYLIKNGRKKNIKYTTQNNAKEIQLNGESLIVYPISYLVYKLTLATKCERTVQTVRKWETTGIIPKCSFIIGSKRFFHMEQIDLICDLAKETKLKQGRSMANFSQRMWEELPTLTKKIKGEAPR
jgi:uncharacterized protein YueI